MKKIILFLVAFSFLNCSNSSQEKATKKISKKAKVSRKAIIKNNTIDNVIVKASEYADNLDFDLDYIRKKGLPDKKHLSEYLGIYLKLYKVADKDGKQKIKQKLEPFYQETLKSSYHNMATVDNKLFKKNSMSYMRIMWVLKELGFDISLYKKELKKVQQRMDDHMKQRGMWQKAVFDKYYDFFKIKKPKALEKAKTFKGPIATKRPLKFYNRNNAYVLTHFIFAAYDYGNKTTQSRFDLLDLEYLSKILPQIIQKYENKGNDDLVAELLTCQVLLYNTDSKQFKNSLKRLLRRQNTDGSFGSYEKMRRKIGKDVEFRYYLHTTLVALETFVEYKLRK